MINNPILNLKNGFPNGMEWTQSNITGESINSIYYANGIWVASSGDSTGLYYSEDGKTWTQSNITSRNFGSICNANGIWVVGSTGLYYSEDGKTWTKGGGPSVYYYHVNHANGIWVASSANSNRTGLDQGEDGRTWTQPNITSGKFDYPYNANGIWVDGRQSSQGLYYSENGKTWTQSNMTSYSFSEIFNANGIWVACYDNNKVSGSRGLYYSEDGKTWTQSNITSGVFRGVRSANGIWVACGIEGLLYSEDGKIWTQSNMTGPNKSFNAAYSANGIWVACGTGDIGLYYSEDGKTWTQSNKTDRNFYNVYNANGIWVACGDDGLYYSVTWEENGGSSGGGSSGGSTTISLQTKSVTPSESIQNITPDSGYNGLSKVTVGAIQTETKTVTANGTVTPSSGKYLKQVTVNVPPTGIDTSDATATASDIAENKTAYVNGEKITGSILVMDGASFQAPNISWDSSKSRLKLSGTSSEKYIYKKGAELIMYCSGGRLGDATAADVAQGKTFTSAAGLKVTGTRVGSGGIDTSDATATASDIVENKTAYVNGEKVTGSLTFSNGINFGSANASWDSQNSRLVLSGNNPFKCAIYENGTSEMYCTSDKLGNATAADVAQGKTFTSAAGLKITGTATVSTPTLQSKTVSPSTSQQIITPDNGYDGLSQITVNAMPSGKLNTPTVSSSGLITAQVGTSGYLASGTKVTKQLTTQAAKTVTPTASEQTVVNSGVYTTGAVKVAAVPSETKTITANGTYTPSSGKFFSSVTVNVPSSGGGGSSNNNCEAYHITSTSAKLNFKTTGTVKVWGYGTAASGYMTSMYAFVGDGYYKSASWGSPTKTSASFSIASDGTLSGLPNMSACDLLVTIGV